MEETNNPDNVASLKRQVETLKSEVKSFGQQRAYFMDIYKRKEEESRRLDDQLLQYKHTNTRLESEIKGIREQVADMKTEHMITCISKDEQLERLKFMHQEELSSLNMSMQELLNENTSQQELQTQINKLNKSNKSLTEELQVVKTALQGRLQRDQDVVRQSFHAENQNSTSSCTAASCYEEKKALHMQLEAAHQTLQKYADIQVNEDPKDKKTKDLFEVVDHEEKIKDLEKELTCEKSSRRDLEMYVAVLAKQKDVFQEEVDEHRKELQESLSLLDKERKEHLNLKLTWQMANDQFLEAQRLLMIDMKRLESVLTEEQQRRVAELQKVDAEREAQQQKIDDLERQKQQQINRIEAEGDSLLDLPGTLRNSSSHTSLNSVDVYGDFERAEPIQLTVKEALPADCASADDCVSLGRGTVIDMPTSAVSKPLLTEDMTSALAAPQAQDVENKRVLDQLRQNTPDRSVSPSAGSRIVSDRQWTKLQDELQQSRAKLGRPCDMCKNYELELQKEQAIIKSQDSQLTQSRQNVKSQQKVIAELEETMSSMGTDCQQQLKEMSKHIDKTDEQLFVLRATFEESTQEYQARLCSLDKEREDIQAKLKCLELENEQLLDMHSNTSQEMLDEQFNQPADLLQAQELLSKFRQNLITCKAAKEHLDRKLKADIRLLKDQAVAEELQWKGREELLNQEIASLQEKNVRLESIKSELKREAGLRQDLTEKLEEANRAIESGSTRESHLKTQIQSLVSQLTELRQKNQTLTDKLRNLQSDLANSESVQKDFVKLSQQLQIQLEKIRQAETEVRWEYEDDVSQCNNCSIELTSNRDKHHCMHCGKVHCNDCSSKVVRAGPKHRPTRVCDVCHTILESEATPYFSTESQSSKS